MVHIFEYLDPKLVMFLEASHRDEVLALMIDRVFSLGKIDDKKRFFDAIVSREEIVSTGIGMGVAIPHSKFSNCRDFFIVIGILKNGVDWHSLDGGLVRIIFLIGGPDDKQTEYLQLLSSLTLAIKNEEMRKKMLTLNSAEAMMDLFKLHLEE